MLTRLTVENYALIDSLSINFDSRLNIITGETGAGKSILLGALGLLLGDKSESGVQKDPTKSCSVEGVFELGGCGLEPLFESNDLDYDNTTTIRRIISASGKSRAFVNDIPVQLSTLKELGSHLIDIHSQHQNLLLRDDAFRIGIVDGIASHGEVLSRYHTAYEHLGALKRQLQALKADAEQSRREQEYLTYQVEQFDAIKLREGEQDELEAEYAVLTNADRIREAMGMATDSLSEEQTGVLVRLKSIIEQFTKISESLPTATETASRIESSYLELKDIEAGLEEQIEHVSSDAESLDKVTARLNAIYELEQKYRATTFDELLKIEAEAKARLAVLDSEQASTAKLESEIEGESRRTTELAARISEGRRKAAPRISKSVVAMLTRLGIGDAVFEVSISPTEELRANGGDNIEFLFSANRGVAPRGIERIASGGEISRVMLALKALTAQRTGLPTIIFDEIDTGVSGRVADAMGDIINELSDNMQVINITHLPQVASKGDSHLLVYKQDGATHIKPLESDERIRAIASMISGSTITESALAQARELLGRQH